MPIHEIVVRPVVRYIVTSFTDPKGKYPFGSVEFGEFDNVDRANVVASAMAEADMAANPDCHTVVELARKLRIDRVNSPLTEYLLVEPAAVD